MHLPIPKVYHRGSHECLLNAEKTNGCFRYSFQRCHSVSHKHKNFLPLCPYPKQILLQMSKFRQYFKPSITKILVEPYLWVLTEAYISHIISWFIITTHSTPTLSSLLNAAPAKGPNSCCINSLHLEGKRTHAQCSLFLMRRSFRSLV